MIAALYHKGSVALASCFTLWVSRGIRCLSATAGSHRFIEQHPGESGLGHSERDAGIRCKVTFTAPVGPFQGRPVYCLNTVGPVLSLPTHRLVPGSNPYEPT